MKYKLIIPICLFVLTACVNTHKDLFVSQVDINTLKEMLTNQKCHNKAVFIFDPGCPTCLFYLRNEYPVMQTKFLDSIDYVFVSIETIDFEKYKEFFHSIGIKSGCLLSLHENNPDYLQPDGKINMSKTMQYVFSNKENMYIKGFPVSAMANKENRLKLEHYLTEDSTFVIRPKPWHKLDTLSLDKIDFDKIDDRNTKKMD